MAKRSKKSKSSKRRRNKGPATSATLRHLAAARKKLAEMRAAGTLKKRSKRAKGKRKAAKTKLTSAQLHAKRVAAGKKAARTRAKHHPSWKAKPKAKRTTARAKRPRTEKQLRALSAGRKKAPRSKSHMARVRAHRFGHQVKQFHLARSASRRARTAVQMFPFAAATVARAANRGHKKGGKGYHRNSASITAPVQGIKTIGTQIPAILKQGAAVGGGYVAASLATGLVNRYAPSLGKWAGLAGAGAGLAASFFGAGLIGKVPVAGKIVTGQLNNIRVGMGVFALKTILGALVAPETRAKFGLSGHNIFDSPQMRGVGEYVRLPGGPGMGEYVMDGAGEDAGSAVALMSQNPMATADRLAAAEDRQAQMSGLGGAGELDADQLTAAMGEYVRTAPGMADYVNTPYQGLGHVTEAVGRWENVFQGMGDGPIPGQSHEDRNMIDFPPTPSAPITAQMAADGAPIDEEYNSPLDAQGIFAGGPFCG